MYAALPGVRAGYTRCKMVWMESRVTLSGLGLILNVHLRSMKHPGQGAGVGLRARNAAVPHACKTTLLPSGFLAGCFTVSVVTYAVRVSQERRCSVAVIISCVILLYIRC